MRPAEPPIIILIGLLQVVGALALLTASKKLPPNPVIGFRVSYSMASKKAWRKLNRLAGGILAGIGLVCIPVGLAWGIIAEVVFLLVGDTIASIALIEYSRHYIEKQLIAEPAPISPVIPVTRPGPVSRVAIVTASAASAIATIFATRYLLSENMPQTSLVILGSLALPLYFSYLSITRPEVYAYPWLGEKEYKAILTLSPIMLSLLVTGVDLLVLGENIAGIILLLASFIIVALELFIVIKSYLGSYG